MGSWLLQGTSQKDFLHCRDLRVAEVTQNVPGTTAPPVYTGEPNGVGRVKGGMLDMSEGGLEVKEAAEMFQVQLMGVWLEHQGHDMAGIPSLILH